jgi:hypothetical protein
MTPFGQVTGCDAVFASHVVAAALPRNRDAFLSRDDDDEKTRWRVFLTIVTGLDFAA